MKRTISIVFVSAWLLGCGGGSSAPLIVDGVLDLRSWDVNRRGALPLKGGWEFHWKELQPEPAAKPTAFGPIDSPWVVPFVGRAPDLAPQGYATYRVRVHLPDTAGEQAWGLRTTSQTSALEIRVDGRTIFQSGKPGRSLSETEHSRGRATLFFVRRAADAGRPLVIDMTVANHAHPRGGAGGRVMFGTARQVENANRMLGAVDWLVFTGLLLLGGYHLGMFAIRRQDRIALYFGLLCLVVSLRTLAIGETLLIDLFPSIPWQVEFRIGYLTYYATVTCALFYIYSVFPRPRWLPVIRVVAVVSFCFSVFALLPFGFGPQAVAARIYHVFGLFGVLFAVGTGVSALRRREQGSRVFCAWILVLVGGALHDMLENLGIVQGAPAFSVALLLFLAGQSLLIYGRFSKAFSEVEELSQKLGAVNRKLEGMSSVKDEFMANLSHELRTPLTLIRGSAELLEMQMNGANPSAESCTQRILAGSDTLIGYVDDLMLVTDVESVPELHDAEVPVAELFADAALRYADLAAEKGINVVAESAPGDVVRGDVRLLRRALENVVKNAIMYNRPGGRVELRSQKQDGSIVLSVHDTGIGIPSEQIAAIWEKFQRLGRDNGSGVGLGLFLARKIVELHEGEVRATSEPGSGTTVSLRFPGQTAESVAVGGDGYKATGEQE